MADQTPDPWKNITQALYYLLSQDAWEAFCADLDRARDAERQQHQQTIQQQAAQLEQLRAELAELDALALAWAEKRGAYTANAKGVLLSLVSSGASRPTEGEQGAPQ